MKKILTLVATVAFCVWMLGCGSGSKNNNGFTVSGSGTSGATAALAYLAGSANDFIGIKVDSSPTAVPTAGSPYSFSSSVNSLAIRNNLLFVALGSISGAPSTINGYKADANGALTQLSSISLNGESTLAYDQSGKFLYAGNNFVPVPGQNSTAPGVYGFSVDQSSGVLTPLPGSPWVLAEGLSESALVVSPNGNLICFAVGIAQGTGNVDCYPRNSDGTLNVSSFFTPIQGEVVSRLTISSDSLWVYAGGGSSNFVFYGSLANAGGSQQLRADSLGTFPLGVAADPTGKWLAVADTGTNNVTIFSTGTDGAPTAGKITVTPGKPNLVAFSQQGAFLFVSTDAGAFVYSFNGSTGALIETAGSPLAGGNGSSITAQ